MSFGMYDKRHLTSRVPRLLILFGLNPLLLLAGNLVHRQELIHTSSDMELLSSREYKEPPHGSLAFESVMAGSGIKLTPLLLVRPRASRPIRLT
jgi:hypothetical protein